MVISDKYTTNEKIDAEAVDEEIKDKIEPTKTILSNDAYAVGEMVEQLTFKLESLRALL